MKRFLLTTAAALLIGTASASAYTTMTFRVPLDVSGGHMNVRNGPGANHALIGEIPAGSIVHAATCVPRDDGVRGADWCFIELGRSGGWVSQVGLMPLEVPPETRIEVTPDQPPAYREAQHGGLVCGAPVVSVGDTYDGNPVISVEVKYNAADHAWRVFHHRANGEVVSRSEQYAIVDASDDNKAQWRGSLNRNRSIYMIGEARREQGQIIYAEWMYDRGLGGKLVMQATAKCSTGNANAMIEPTR
jgi:hypothetical protein